MPGLKVISYTSLNDMNLVGEDGVPKDGVVEKDRSQTPYRNAPVSSD